MSDFGKYWDNLEKHKKRLYHWRPHWRSQNRRLGKTRPLRYFTLCAMSMIDVFMLVREKILKVDKESLLINSVRVCESDDNHYTAIKEILGENAVTRGYLEKIALFQDNDFTSQFPTVDDIESALDKRGEAKSKEEETENEKLQLKRIWLRFKESFPYDFINLDFCDYYYPKPPDILRINKTVEKFLDWQRKHIEGSGPVKEFMVAVTCRHDDNIPPVAIERLSNLIRHNLTTSDVYRSIVVESRAVTDSAEWLAADKEDFFLAGWPKDIARSAKERGWATNILDYVYYNRVGDHNHNKYIMVCIVIHFTLIGSEPAYMQSALYALDKNNRKFIDEIVPNSPEGIKLRKDLEGVVAIRNKHARRAGQDELPPPLSAPN